MKGYNMVTTTNFNIERILIAVTLILALAIVSFTFLYVSSEENKLKSVNIENAIEKGIDPMAVRCAYAKSDDRICLAYAITKKGVDAPELNARLR